MKYSIVTDTGWGDSGKGMVVHDLCQKSLDNKVFPCVVRFSGGPQAGHTVIHDGIKHIFSSFGSGTLQGCPTYFTEDTCIKLNCFINEWVRLDELGLYILFGIHPEATVVLPIDQILGRKREKENNHGSCGKGVGAALKRNKETPFKFYVRDLFLPLDYVKEKLLAITNLVCEAEEEYRSWTEIYKENEKFLKDLKDFREIFEYEGFFMGSLNKFWGKHRFDHFIFEGSQGLLLDQDIGFFPHVTYGNVSAKNAVKHIPEGAEVDVYYATRCYATRHGNGPFSEGFLPLVNNEEEINVKNEWQGDFRVGPLDTDLLKWAINADKKTNYENHPPNFNLVISCIDQLPKKFTDDIINEMLDFGFDRIWTRNGADKQMQ